MVANPFPPHESMHNEVQATRSSTSFREGGTLTLPAVNFHALAKHHLTSNGRGTGVLTVADDLCGLHATSNVTPYLSLFNRIPHFTVEDLSRELYVRKSLLRIRAMRETFFLVTRRLLPTVTAATQVSRERIQRPLRKAGITPSEFQTLSRTIIRLVSDHAKTTSEIKGETEASILRTLNVRRGWRPGRRSNLNLVLNLLVLDGTLQSQTEQLDWSDLDWDGYGLRKFSFNRRVLYSVAARRMVHTSELEKARRQLANRYIKSYGPVSVQDVAWWMDLPRTEATGLVNSLKEELVKMRIVGLPGEYLVHQDDFEDLQRISTSDTVVNFLPYEDPYVKGVKVRSRLLAPELENTGYSTGNALPTVLVDGRIVGTWSTTIQENVLHVLVRKLVPVEKAAAEKVQKEGERLGRFLMREAKVQVSIEDEPQWRKTVAKSRPTFYLTGIPKPRSAGRQS